MKLKTMILSILMRTTFVLMFVLMITSLFSQDTTVTWLTNIDTTKFKIYYKKRVIPKDFFSIVAIDNRREIVSAGKRYRQGCIGNLPGQRLNWLAKDDKDHWVLSISFGGRAHGTKYIYIDRDKGSLNINGFRFFGKDKHDLTLGGTISKIKEGQFFRIDSSLFNLPE